MEQRKTQDANSRDWQKLHEHDIRVDAQHTMKRVEPGVTPTGSNASPSTHVKSTDDVRSVRSQLDNMM